MSGFRKFAIITAVILIALGVILTVTASAMLEFDMKGLSTVRYEEKTYITEETFINITIDVMESDIQILPATDSQCKIVYTDIEKIDTNISVTNGTLKLTKSDSRRWYEHIGIWWVSNNSIKVYLPIGEYNKLVLKTVSGDISVPEEYTFKTVELKSTSGELHFISEASENVFAKTTSGDIHLKNFNCSTLEVDSTSGDITLKDITTSGNIAVEAVSGDIEFSSVKTAAEAYIKTVSGDVSLNRSDATLYRIKTTSGDVEGNILSPKNFITDTTSGDVDVPRATENIENKCYITTTSGDIEFEVTG